MSGIRDMREGVGFLQEHIDAARGIAATAIHRGGLTALTLTALLLERNTFNDPNKPEEGLAGFGFALSFAGIGLTLGAFLAPYGVARFGRHRWIRLSLFTSAVFPIILAVHQSQVTLIVTAFFTAFCGQNLKVTNDALVLLPRSCFCALRCHRQWCKCFWGNHCRLVTSRIRSFRGGTASCISCLLSWSSAFVAPIKIFTNYLEFHHFNNSCVAASTPSCPRSRRNSIRKSIAWPTARDGLRSRISIT